jgi:hypothetical protein
MYRTQIVDVERWYNDGDKTEVDLAKRAASKLAGWWAVDSLSGFYRHNTYMLGVQVASFVASLIAVFYDLFGGKPKEEGGRKEENSDKVVKA